MENVIAEKEKWGKEVALKEAALKKARKMRETAIGGLAEIVQEDIAKFKREYEYAVQMYSRCSADLFHNHM
jgi:hypothetical protein